MRFYSPLLFYQAIYFYRNTLWCGLVFTPNSLSTLFLFEMKVHWLIRLVMHFTYPGYAALRSVKNPEVSLGLISGLHATCVGRSAVPWLFSIDCWPLFLAINSQLAGFYTRLYHLLFQSWVSFRLQCMAICGTPRMRMGWTLFNFSLSIFAHKEASICLRQYLGPTESNRLPMKLRIGLRL